MKKKNKQDKRHGEGTGRGRLNHAGDTIGNFKADTMTACITEINFWENKAKQRGRISPTRRTPEIKSASDMV